MTPEQQASFKVAAEPLIKWLAENAHPHHHALVVADGAELLEGECTVKNDSWIKG